MLYQKGQYAIENLQIKEDLRQDLVMSPAVFITMTTLLRKLKEKPEKYAYDSNNLQLVGLTLFFC